MGQWRIESHRKSVEVVVVEALDAVKADGRMAMRAKLLRLFVMYHRNIWLESKPKISREERRE